MGAGRSGPVQSKSGITMDRPLPFLMQYNHASAGGVCTFLCSGHAACSSMQQGQTSAAQTLFGVGLGKCTLSMSLLGPCWLLPCLQAGSCYAMATVKGLLCEAYCQDNPGN